MMGNHSKDYKEGQDFSEKERLKTSERVISNARFLSGIIHEIRTPMNAIVGFSKLLEDISKDPMQLDYIRKIQEASTHLLEIVNDVLDISKIESGQIVIEHRPFDLKRLLSQVVDLFKDDAFKKSLYLDIESDVESTKMIGDQTRIRQILVNLVSNAIKFTDSGGISIVATFNAKQSELIIRVRDTGIGMTPPQIDALFDDYAQASASTSRLFGGTGLGLSISRKLAEKMKGSLSAESQLHVGSTFTLKVPVDIDGVTSEDPDEMISPEQRRIRTGSRILISEDHPLSMKLAIRILTQFGMMVTAVQTNKEALETFLNAPFDLVLLDLETPDMHGLEAVREMRKREPELPILALSAHVKSEIEPRCIDAGFTGIITKPIDPKSLYQALITYLFEII